MIGGIRRLYHGESNIDFPKAWRRWLIVSAVLIVLSISSLVMRGLNLGVAFEGGSSWEVVAPELSVEETRDALRSVGADSATIQVIGTDTVRVRSGINQPDAVEEVTEAIADAAGQSVDDVALQSVSASWSGELTSNAITALIWFFIVIALYITIRLEWKMAVGALAAVVHDIIISVGVYSVFWLEVTPATVVAFLTIMGYSLYDTIVVYDKAREISGRVGATGKYTYTEMINLSLNQVLMRSINSTFTSTLPVLSMLFVGTFLLGASTLAEFSIALLVGLIVGGYSSLIIASWIVAVLKEREPRYREIRERRAMGDEQGGTRIINREDAVLGTAGRLRRTAPTQTSSGAQRPAATGAIPPRPRKKKRR